MAAPEGNNNQISEFMMAIFVLFLLIILLCELPNWVINVCICLNITLGVVLMMFALYIQKTLELSSFPSIILVGTMFRLCLSIASTRLILAKGEAGEVIHAFGEFVTGGNMIVGGVIFLIITVVQFMVITKGAERIAEVSVENAYGLLSRACGIKPRHDNFGGDVLFVSIVIVGCYGKTFRVYRIAHKVFGLFGLLGYFYGRYLYFLYNYGKGAAASLIAHCYGFFSRGGKVVFYPRGIDFNALALSLGVFDFYFRAVKG